MSSKGDFIAWEDSDINLDLLLGEYTASDIDSDSENPPPKRTKKDISKLYQCPECDATYSSVSGFRGHLRKKHSLTNVKLSEHKTDQAKAKQPEPKLSLDQNELTQLIKDSTFLTLEEITNCPFCKTTSRGQNIMKIAQMVKDDKDTSSHIIEILTPKFSNIIKSAEIHTNLDMTANERLFQQYQQHATDKSIQTELYRTITTIPDAEKLPCKQFLAIMQDGILKHFVSERAKLFTKKTVEPSKLSDTDQAVIFYISGYIISALQKPLKTKNKELSLQIENITSRNSTSTKKAFVSKYGEWTAKLNRGGLKTPSDDFFLLVREFETCYRKFVDLKSITSLTLDKSYLIMKILDDYMVNHYWNHLCSDQVSVKEFLLEKCISMFLTVRGHSTARHIKLMLAEKRETNKPLRQALKDKSNKC